jgi:arginine:ornithine antiporter/lysine permease
VRQAALVNVITTVAKIAPIVLFIAVAAVAFRLDVFSMDFSGPADGSLGGVLDQAKSTMLVTLWVFIGIEGASVVSSRAERRRDIGIATIAGFLTCLGLYALVSLLSLGVMQRPELAALQNPSMAGVLEHVVGAWGAALVNIAVVVSVCGAFLSWTLFAAEIANVAAKRKTLPRVFATDNATGAPASALWITNILVQLFLIVTLYAQSTYQALYYIASTAILVPYVFSGAYALKLAVTGESYRSGENRSLGMIAGIVATLYGAWLVYAAGPAYLFMCAMLYAPGIVAHAIARREAGERIFYRVELVLAAGLLVAGIWAAYDIWAGIISPL